MALKKIYLFASVASQYGVVDHFVGELANALNRQGVISRIIEAKRDDPRSFLQALLNDPPDCTLSFNGLLPDEEGRFLADMIKIPHVAYLTDAPNRFFPLVKSAYTIIACIDRHFCQIFCDLRFQRLLFLPHAVDRSLSPELNVVPDIDVLMLNSFIDCDEIRANWSSKYSPAVAKVLEEAAERALSERDLPYMQAFTQVLDQHLRAGHAINPRQLNYPLLLDELEAYVGGKSRLELLRAIEAPVHVYGAQNGKLGWKKYLKGRSNVRVHPPVAFSEALALMRRAKIVLNCTPEIKHGTHERILSALAVGAAVLTADAPYMHEHFQDEENILFFQAPDWKSANQKIQAYLHDEEKRCRLAGKGRELVLKHHTWDQRAQTLVQELPALLEGIRHAQSA